MLINRPCLSDLRGSNQGESPEMLSFIETAASSCVDSAKKIIYIIFQGISNAAPFTAVRLGPWWCIVYYAVSAEAVLLLEMSFGSIHVNEQKRDSMLMEAQNVLRWLQSISCEGYTGGIERCCAELTYLLAWIAPLSVSDCGYQELLIDGSGREFDFNRGQPAAQGQEVYPWRLYQPPQAQDTEMYLELTSSGPVGANYFPVTKFLHEPGSSGYNDFRKD